MKQLLEWAERLNAELDAMDGKQIHRVVARDLSDRDIERLVKIVDERLAEAIRREGEF